MNYINYIYIFDKTTSGWWLGSSFRILLEKNVQPPNKNRIWQNVSSHKRQLPGQDSKLLVWTILYTFVIGDHHTTWKINNWKQPTAGYDVVLETHWQSPTRKEPQDRTLITKHGDLLYKAGKSPDMGLKRDCKMRHWKYPYILSDLIMLVRW